MYRIGYVDFVDCRGLQKAILDSGHHLNLYFLDTKVDISHDYMCQQRNVTVYNGDLEGLYKNSDFVIFNGKGYNIKKYKDLAKKYNVVNINLHNEESYRLEKDRSFGKEFVYNMTGVENPNIDSLNKPELLDFINKYGDVVFKSNANDCKTYIPFSKEEAIDIVEEDSLGYLKNLSCIIEKRVYGKELCIGAYFNGSNWVGNTVFFNQEYKQLFDGDTSNILTGEVGTIFKLVPIKDSPKMVQDILAKLKTFLVEQNYIGYIDLNFIKEDGKPPVLLEFTCREGYPTQFIVPFVCSNYGDFYAACAGLKKTVNIKKGYYCCVCLNTGTACSQILSMYVTKPDEKWRIFGLDKNCIPMYAFYSESGKLYHSCTDREVYVVGKGDSLELAQSICYESAAKIKTYLLNYRKDIGCNWIEPDDFFRD